jgi:hypothetical protein
MGVHEDKGQLDAGLEVHLGLALKLHVPVHQVLERDFLLVFNNKQGQKMKEE